MQAKFYNVLYMIIHLMNCSKLMLITHYIATILNMSSKMFRLTDCIISLEASHSYQRIAWSGITCYTSRHTHLNHADVISWSTQWNSSPASCNCDITVASCNIATITLTIVYIDLFIVEQEVFKWWNSWFLKGGSETFKLQYYYASFVHSLTL